jgi:hypothetical protein
MMIDYFNPYLRPPVTLLPVTSALAGAIEQPRSRK